MKILHVGPVKPARSATGVAQSIRGFVLAQAAIGLKVELLSSSPLPQGKSIEELPGVHMLEGLRRRHYNPWLISQGWITRIQTELGTPDLVNFHSVYTSFHVALARRCRRLGWPYIITPHGGMTYLAQNVKRTKKSFANFLYFRAYVRHATAIHALCPREAEEIQSLFDVKKIIIAPNGVDDYLLEAAKKLSPADLGDFGHEGDLVLGFVGRIDIYHKGLDMLLKAMAILKSQFNGLRCKLFVIGPFYTKRDKQSFHSALESLGLRNNVKILGPKYDEEKLRYFLACDVFVHTSRFEGMPMAVIEAMALGRPCLVTPGTNTADVVHQGGGWVCEGNPKSIAEAIKSIYEKRDFLEALGQQSRELIKSQFTWHKVTQQLKVEYSKILDQANY
ncbi:MAG: hypothetical protein AMJ43_07720 [Coxiella sp. DG_40]|nr:MAG: hypothetical protein AMJ43_07720 [Coxiella sp. DG_40]